MKATAKICQINIKLNQSIILLTWLFNAKSMLKKNDLLTFTRCSSLSFDHSNSFWLLRMQWLVLLLLLIFLLLQPPYARAYAELITLNVHVAINSCNLVSNLNQRIEFVPCFSLADYLLDIRMFSRAVFISFESQWNDVFRIICVCFFFVCFLFASSLDLAAKRYRSIHRATVT